MAMEEPAQGNLAKLHSNTIFFVRRVILDYGIGAELHGLIRFESAFGLGSIWFRFGFDLV